MNIPGVDEGLLGQCAFESGYQPVLPFGEAVASLLHFSKPSFGLATMGAPYGWKTLLRHFSEKCKDFNVDSDHLLLAEAAFSSLNLRNKLALTTDSSGVASPSFLFLYFPVSTLAKSFVPPFSAETFLEEETALLTERVKAMKEACADCPVVFLF